MRKILSILTVLFVGSFLLNSSVFSYGFRCPKSDNINITIKNNAINRLIVTHAEEGQFDSYKDGFSYRRCIERKDSYVTEKSLAGTPGSRRLPISMNRPYTTFKLDLDFPKNLATGLFTSPAKEMSRTFTREDDGKTFVFSCDDKGQNPTLVEK